MAGVKVHLVFGPKTRIVPVRVAGGRVSQGIISEQIRPREKFLGTIGHYKGGLTPTKAEEILKDRVDTGSVIASRIAIPEMINISGKVRIMIEEVTVGLFKQVMEGYEIKGHNADDLRAILADPARENKPLTYVSLLDAREFATRLSKLTGRKFRVQTEVDWVAGAGSLQGNNWTWTETKYGDRSFVLRHLTLGYRYSFSPVYRYCTYAARLVEDITA